MPDKNEPTPEQELETVVCALADTLAGLQRGPLAVLRRATPGEGTAAFWRVFFAAGLDKRCEPPANRRFYGHLETSEAWEWVVTAFAMLTDGQASFGDKPASDSGITHPTRHNQNLRLGRLLQETDLSQLRMAKLLNSPFPQRREGLLRIVRRLARGSERFNFVELGRLFLFEDADAAGLRNVAHAYYMSESAQLKQKEKQDA